MGVDVLVLCSNALLKLTIHNFLNVLLAGQKPLTSLISNSCIFIDISVSCCRLIVLILSKVVSLTVNAD